MKKFLMIGLFILYGCYCIDPNQSDANYTKQEETEPEPKINFRIVNHTNNIYTKNALYSLKPVYKQRGEQTDRSKSYFIYKKDCPLYHRIITHIRPNSTVENSENGDKKLCIAPSWPAGWSDKNYSYYVPSGNRVLMLSLNNGKEKIFFGEYEYSHFREGKSSDDGCTYEFIKWVVDPVWQNKNVDIHIYGDRVEIDNLKKVTKIKGLEMNINNIPVVGVEVKIMKGMRRCY